MIDVNIDDTFLPGPWTVAYRLMTEDWSDWTLDDMSHEFNISTKGIVDAIKSVKKNYGFTVNYLRNPTKKQANRRKFKGQVVHGRCEKCSWYWRGWGHGWSCCDYNYYAYYRGEPRHGYISERYGGCDRFTTEETPKLTDAYRSDIEGYSDEIWKRKYFKDVRDAWKKAYYDS